MRLGSRGHVNSDNFSYVGDCFSGHPIFNFAEEAPRPQWQCPPISTSVVVSLLKIWSRVWYSHIFKEDMFWHPISHIYSGQSTHFREKKRMYIFGHTLCIMINWLWIIIGTWRKKKVHMVFLFTLASLDNLLFLVNINRKITSKK